MVSISTLDAGRAARRARSGPGRWGKLPLGLALVIAGPGWAATGADILPTTFDFAAPQVDALPERLLFDATPVDTLSAPQPVTLSNAGIATLALGAISLPVGYVRTGGSCAGTIEPGSSCTIAISFSPKAPGTIEGGLVITSDAGSRSVMLHGLGTALSQLPAMATASFGGR